VKVKYRIRSNEDFAECVKKGKCLKSESFTLHYKNTEIGFTRVGVSVSSKLGCAVVRNKIKRQIREMIGSLVDFDKRSTNIVVVARKPFLDKDFHTNLSSLQTLLLKMEEN